MQKKEQFLHLQSEHDYWTQLETVKSVIITSEKSQV